MNSIITQIGRENKFSAEIFVPSFSLLKARRKYSVLFVFIHSPLQVPLRGVHSFLLPTSLPSVFARDGKGWLAQ